MILNLPLEIFLLPRFPPPIKRNRYILFCLLMAVFSQVFMAFTGAELILYDVNILPT